MTALKKYQKLESGGLWRDAPDSQLRDVVVSFGEASLVFSEPKNGTALSHWSLPAVARLNPGALPAVYSPGPDAAETLELDDMDMIAALETVRAALSRAQPKPGRLRGAVVAGGTALVIGLGVLWLPGALVSHTAAVVPPSKRAEIGQNVLDDLIRLTGAPCTGELGQRALAGLAERLFGPVDTPILLVVRDGVQVATHLPGGVVVLSQALIDKQDGPEAAAGAALVETARAAVDDPLIPVLRHAGLRATFGLLTSGQLPKEAVAGYGEALLRADPTVFEDPALLAVFERAGVTSSPYAYALDPSGESHLSLIEGDPQRGKTSGPLMPDGDWVSLQGICTG